MRFGSASWSAIILGIAAGSPHAAQGHRTQIYSRLSDSVVHLPSGDCVEFQRALQPHFTGDPPFVVMRAIDVPASRRNQGGTYSLQSFGVVLQHRQDGRWYGLDESAPAF